MTPKIARSTDGQILMGGRQTIKLSSEDTDGKISVILSIVSAGTGVPTHIHLHEDEIFEIVDERAKEIGIRKVLGASVWHIVLSLCIDFLKLVMIALVIALPAGWLASNKWLENYPYRISPSWWMLFNVTVIVILIALVTVSFQAIRIAIANPVKSLRSE